jgi:hypothetical protein
MWRRYGEAVVAHLEAVVPPLKVGCEVVSTPLEVRRGRVSHQERGAAGGAMP